MSTESNPIMPILKEATAAQHSATEENSFNTLLMGGKLPQAAYVDTLAQMLLIHRAYEARLRAAQPAIAYEVPAHEFQTPYLEADLAFFERDATAIEPVPATQTFLDFIAAIPTSGDDALRLLGVHYVFEGSNNGSKWAAKSIREAYDLPETSEGTRYFDRYGQKQAKNWKYFKDTMNEIEFNDAQRAALVNAAVYTFDAIGLVHRDLGERFAAVMKG